MEKSRASAKTQSGLELGIRLQKPLFYTQEDLQGALYLNVPIATQCSGLDLQITVVEQVQWEDYSAGSTKEIKSKKRHYDSSYELANFGDDTVSPGSYVFPFSVEIPTVPEGSFDFVSGSHKAQVKYTVKGKVRGGKEIA